MAQKKESFFWTSYSDLMTSLFFIMLTLFVVVIVVLGKRMETTENELKAIKQVRNSTTDLQETGYFNYNEDHKKFILTVKTHFPENEYSFDKLQNTNIDSLKQAGVEIRKFLTNHNDNNYLLIIEGQASRNSQFMAESNYMLSFQRALALMKFWKNDCKIDFGTNCEIQIAGSGDGRYNFGYTDGDIGTTSFDKHDLTLMRERGGDEIRNQRFLIHIIPKNLFPKNTINNDNKKDF